MEEEQHEQEAHSQESRAQEQQQSPPAQGGWEQGAPPSLTTQPASSLPSSTGRRHQDPIYQHLPTPHLSPSSLTFKNCCSSWSVYFVFDFNKLSLSIALSDVALIEIALPS